MNIVEHGMIIVSKTSETVPLGNIGIISDGGSPPVNGINERINATATRKIDIIVGTMKHFSIILTTFLIV